MGGRHEVSRSIRADASTLYEMVSDLPRMGEWSPENAGGRWLRGGPVEGGRFRGHNRLGWLRWSTNVEIVKAVPGVQFEFVVHLVWPLRHLVTWGYIFERAEHGTMVREYRQDHRRGWLVWLASKRIARLGDPDAHYVRGMELTLERLAATAEAGI